MIIGPLLVVWLSKAETRNCADLSPIFNVTLSRACFRSICLLQIDSRSDASSIGQVS